MLKEQLQKEGENITNINMGVESVIEESREG